MLIYYTNYTVYYTVVAFLKMCLHFWHSLSVRVVMINVSLGHYKKYAKFVSQCSVNYACSAMVLVIHL